MKMSPTRESLLMPGSSKVLKPSPNEESAIIKEALAERRKHRLLQVRLQEKRLAEKIRHAVRRKREGELQALDKHLQENWEAKVAVELEQLEKEYRERLESIGEGHKSSSEIPERNDLISKQLAAEKALQRYKEAFQKLTEQNLVALKEREGKCQLRESIAKKEQARASLMASKPLPMPDFVLNAQSKNRASSSRSKSMSSFSTTRYHMAIAFAEKAESDPAVNATEAAKDLEEKLLHAKNVLSRDLNERKEKSRLRHEYARQQVLLDQSKDRLMQQLEELEHRDRIRRQQVLQKIPAQVFQPPHQRLEDAATKQIELEEVFENAHHINRVTHQTALQLDLDSEDPSIDQTDLIEHDVAEVKPSQMDEPFVRGEITTSKRENDMDDVFITSGAAIDKPEKEQPGASTRMQKLLGRIRKQQNEWVKRSVRLQLNAAESQNTDDDLDTNKREENGLIQTETPRSEIDIETTDSLVSADIESARCTNTNSDSANGDDVPDQPKAASQDSGETKNEDDKSEDKPSPSDQESLLHPFEKAKIIRSAKKQRSKETSTNEIDVDNNSMLQTLENRKHTIENHKHLLEIQKQRLANQILRRELKDTEAELEFVIEKDIGKSPKLISQSNVVDNATRINRRVVENASNDKLPTGHRSVKDKESRQNASLGANNGKRGSLQSDVMNGDRKVESTPEKAQIQNQSFSSGLQKRNQPLSEEPSDSTLPETLSNETKNRPQVLSDVSFMSEIDSSRRADLAKKYPNILKGIVDDGSVTTINNDSNISKDISSMPKAMPELANHYKATQTGRTEGAVVQLERIRNYQRQLLEKQRWLKSRQDVIQGRQNILLEKARKDITPSSILQPTTQSKSSAISDITLEMGDDIRKLGSSQLSSALGNEEFSSNIPKRISADNPGIVEDISPDDIQPHSRKPIQYGTEFPKMNDNPEEMMTRDFVAMLSESRTLSQRRQMYQDLSSPVTAEEGEISKQVNQLSRAVPRLEMQSLSDADVSPTNSGIEADTESIESKLSGSFLHSANVGKVKDVTIANENKQATVKTTDFLSTYSALKKPPRISEKPAFSPIQEVEEKSFRNQRSVLSPGQDEVFRVSGSDSTTSLVEQELSSARSSKHATSPPITEANFGRSNGSVFSFQDLQSILSESDFLPLPTAWKKDHQVFSTRDSQIQNFPTKANDKKTTNLDHRTVKPRDSETSQDWVRLHPDRSVTTDNYNQTSTTIELLRTTANIPYAPFGIISSETTDMNLAKDLLGKANFSSLNERFHKAIPGLKQTNNLGFIVDHETGDMLDKSGAGSLASMRETKPIHLEDSGSSNASKTSLTNLSKYEEILERVRMLPYKHLEEHNRLAESYQTWRKETAEPLIDPQRLYQDRTYNHSHSSEPVTTQLSGIYKPEASGPVYEKLPEIGEYDKMNGETELYQPFVEKRSDSMARQNFAQSTKKIDTVIWENVITTVHDNADNAPFSSLIGTKEPIIHVYEPSLSSHDELDENYNEVPDAFTMDDLMEQRLVQHSYDSQVANNISLSNVRVNVEQIEAKPGLENGFAHTEGDFGIVHTEGDFAFNPLPASGAGEEIVRHVDTKGGQNFEQSISDGKLHNSNHISPMKVAGAEYTATTDVEEKNDKIVDIDKVNMSDLESLQMQYLADYSTKLSGSSFPRTAVDNSDVPSTEIHADETVSELVRLGPIGSSISFPVPLNSEDTESQTESSETSTSKALFRRLHDSSVTSNISSSLTNSTGFENIKNAIANVFANIPNFSTETDDTSSVSTSYFEPRKPVPRSSDDSYIGKNKQQRDAELLDKIGHTSDVESNSTKFDSEGGFAVPPFPRFASTRLAAETESSSHPSLNSSVVSDVKDLNLSLLSNLYFQEDKGRSETSWLFTNEQGIENIELHRAQSSTPNEFLTATDDMPRAADTSLSGSTRHEAISDGSATSVTDNTESVTVNAPVLSWSEVLLSKSNANHEHQDQYLAKKEALMIKSKQRVHRISERRQNGSTTDNYKHKYSVDGKLKRPDARMIAKENQKPKEAKRQTVKQAAFKDVRSKEKPKISKEIQQSVKRGSKELAKQQVLEDNRKRMKQFEKKIQKSLRNRKK